ncbi:hypothetical protein ABFS82_09G087300 [Erythranthe guttata]|uniref:AT-hook motif nuclear-localized protein n=1 Tax=Erythranthe guttata TaxID=4155 RepID=A0A022PZE1_ERYGU|nr:PREDICTED: AT-hook motif nuclear-localized protein 1-like [Erythranthe guttata]EYU21702.1 hypothetical protein MIMGU_mgv1a012030mg [Erythranthe guttata]|eukprot:XP_012856824.1 PREDICTED: AT-hook motif nuclear-localized protein 1-like [Erythranthe guttata]
MAQWLGLCHLSRFPPPPHLRSSTSPPSEKREKSGRSALPPSCSTRTTRISISSSERTKGLGDSVSCSAGASFTPHIITVNAGEDVTMKVISFSQQGPRAICILSANGVVSSITLRQPDSCGGTLTYEGRFEILSLTGSFMPSDTSGMRNRTGGMSVSLASPDGRVVGGGVAGLLVAASPVQIVVGSFLAGNQHEQKTKKHKSELVTAVQAASIPISNTAMEDNNNNNNTYHTSSSFRGDSWSPMPLDMRNYNKSNNDINLTLP